MPERDPDAQLMLSFQRGDSAAFDQLFARWAGPLLRYLERIVHDAAIAEELVQDAFLRVHGARDRYVPEAKFSTWLYRIASNLAFNELRRPHRRHAHDSTDDDNAAVRLRSEEPQPDVVVDARILSEEVEEQWKRLPERQQMALWLCAVEGLSYADIAIALQATEKSVKSLVHRARATLADRLGSRL